MGCEPELLKKEAMPTATRKLDLPEGVPPLDLALHVHRRLLQPGLPPLLDQPDLRTGQQQGTVPETRIHKKSRYRSQAPGIESVKLTGGEPTLHPQFREIVDYIDNEKINILMETNGTLIDTEIARLPQIKKMGLFHFGKPGWRCS